MDSGVCSLNSNKNEMFSGNVFSLFGSCRRGSSHKYLCPKSNVTEHGRVDMGKRSLGECEITCQINANEPGTGQSSVVVNIPPLFVDIFWGNLKWVSGLVEDCL